MKRDVSRRSSQSRSRNGGQQQQQQQQQRPTQQKQPPVPSPEHEKAREAAKQAEREHWERTRGAGSSVMKLLDAGETSKDPSDILPKLEDIQGKVYEVRNIWSPLNNLIFETLLLTKVSSYS